MALQRIADGSTYDNRIDNNHTWGYDYTQHRMDIAPDGQAIGLGTPIPSGGKGLYIDARSSGPTVPRSLGAVSAYSNFSNMKKYKYKLDDDVFTGNATSIKYAAVISYIGSRQTKYRNTHINAYVDEYWDDYHGNVCPITVKGELFTFACDRTGFIHNELIPFMHPQHSTIRRNLDGVQPVYYDGPNATSVAQKMGMISRNYSTRWNTLEEPYGFLWDIGSTTVTRTVALYTNTFSNCTVKLSRMKLYHDYIYSMDIYCPTFTTNTAVRCSYDTIVALFRSVTGVTGGTFFFTGWYGRTTSFDSKQDFTVYPTSDKRIYFSMSWAPVTARNTTSVPKVSTPSYLTEVMGSNIIKKYNTYDVETPTTNIAMKFSKVDTKFGYVAQHTKSLPAGMRTTTTYMLPEYELSTDQWIDYSYTFGYSENPENAVGLDSNIHWDIGNEIRYCNWRLSTNLCMFDNWGLTRDGVGDLTLGDDIMTGTGYTSKDTVLASASSTNPSNPNLYRAAISSQYVNRVSEWYKTFSTKPVMLANYEVRV